MQDLIENNLIMQNYSARKVILQYPATFGILFANDYSRNAMLNHLFLSCMMISTDIARRSITAYPSEFGKIFLSVSEKDLLSIVDNLDEFIQIFQNDVSRKAITKYTGIFAKLFINYTARKAMTRYCKEFGQILLIIGPEVIDINIDHIASNPRLHNAFSMLLRDCHYSKYDINGAMKIIFIKLFMHPELNVSITDNHSVFQIVLANNTCRELIAEDHESFCKILESSSDEVLESIQTRTHTFSLIYGDTEARDIWCKWPTEFNKLFVDDKKCQALIKNLTVYCEVLNRNPLEERANLLENIIDFCNAVTRLDLEGQNTIRNAAYLFGMIYMDSEVRRALMFYPKESVQSFAFCSRFTQSPSFKEKARNFASLIIWYNVTVAIKTCSKHFANLKKRCLVNK